METLVNEQCVACRADSPRVTVDEINALKPQIPGWQIVEQDGMHQLHRTFHLPDFKQALALTDKVGALAEAQGHHPAIVTEWGKVKVMWWTHSIKGLHRNDFVMAARTGEIAAELGAT
ncbi:MAG: 4a-hydroxytetrahydrobiopterin dehydratase [Herpetosiphon sp.]